jgi:hypothetical protein
MLLQDKITRQVHRVGDRSPPPGGRDLLAEMNKPQP